MKKGLLVLCIIILISSCAFLPRRAAEINWPEKIAYIEALCELDMAWKDMNYTGSMALKLEYPEMIQIEVYGPFGDTAVYLKKDKGRFVLVAGDETFSDERAFQEKFNIRLADFIDDIAGAGSRRIGVGETTVQRDGYRVVYNLGGKENRICWEGEGGNICIRFMEARFNQ
ncbi:MAG: hypothetical protein C0392_14155 [Syntrophus sp. (in: bacteria)]|nr:hypothetical protein [Syntrophus sp. (in: bacteria)]